MRIVEKRQCGTLGRQGRTGKSMQLPNLERRRIVVSESICEVDYIKRSALGAVFQIPRALRLGISFANIASRLFLHLVL